MQVEIMELSQIDKTKEDVNKVEIVGDDGLSAMFAPGSPAAIVQGMTAEEYAACEKKLKRKLDIRLLAMATMIYILNFLDRVCADHSGHGLSDLERN